MLVIASPPAPGERAAETDLGPAVQGLLDAWPGAELRWVDHPSDLDDLEGFAAVFNACEAPLGRPDLDAVTASLLEWKGVPYTGASADVLALCRRKDRVRAVLAAAGVPVPDVHGLPCIVKPADEDGSFGIDERSICYTEVERAAAMARLDHAVAERFLPGREHPVALWRGPNGWNASEGEVRFEGGQRLVTYAAKWDPTSAEWARTPVQYPAPVPPEQRARLHDVALRAWTALSDRGYARVDLRCEEDGTPYVIDVNPNPDISPGAGLHRAVEAAGWTWGEFVRAQVLAALEEA